MFITPFLPPLLLEKTEKNYRLNKAIEDTNCDVYKLNKIIYNFFPTFDIHLIWCLTLLVAQDRVKGRLQRK